MENAKQFLSPQSMLTPGVAGGTVMMITNTLISQFKLIYPWPSIVAITVSFIVGLLVWASEVKPYWKRFIYYVVNSFIIFNVAIGANTLGQGGGEITPDVTTIMPIASKVYAQTTNGW